MVLSNEATLDLDLLRSSDHKKSPSISSGTNKGNETSGLSEEVKDGTPMEDCPSQDASEPILLQCQVANHLLELIENSSKRNLVNGSKTENKVKNLEANIELEALKMQLRESERENRQKAKLLEESEEKLEKLSRRLAASPWTPYAITQKHHFNEQPGVHDCLCIICGENMKLNNSSNNSPEVIAPFIFIGSRL